MQSQNDKFKIDYLRDSCRSEEKQGGSAQIEYYLFREQVIFHWPTGSTLTIFNITEILKTVKKVCNVSCDFELMLVWCHYFAVFKMFLGVKQTYRYILLPVYMCSKHKICLFSLLPFISCLPITVHIYPSQYSLFICILSTIFSYNAYTYYYCSLYILLLSKNLNLKRFCTFNPVRLLAKYVTI